MAPTTRSMDADRKRPAPTSPHHQPRHHPLPPSSSSLTPTPPLLPPELWSLIVHHLAHYTLHSPRLYTATLLSLTLANKQLHHLATPHLYANPYLDTDLKEGHFWRTIAWRPAKWWHVRSLFIGERRWDPTIPDPDGDMRYKTVRMANGEVSSSIVAGVPKSHRASPHLGRVGRAIALAGEKRTSHIVVEAGSHSRFPSSTTTTTTTTTTTPSQQPYVASRSISVEWMLAFHLCNPYRNLPTETGPDPLLLENVAWWEKGQYDRTVNGHFYSTRPVGAWSEDWEKKKEERVARETAKEAEMERRRGGPIISWLDDSSDSSSSQGSTASSNEDEDQHEDEKRLASTLPSTSTLQTSAEVATSIPAAASLNNATPRRLPWHYRLTLTSLDPSLFKLFYAMETLTHIELLIYPDRDSYSYDLARLLRSLLKRSKMPLLESLLLIISEDAGVMRFVAERVDDPRFEIVLSKTLICDPDRECNNNAVRRAIVQTWFEAVHGYDYAWSNNVPRREIVQTWFEAVHGYDDAWELDDEEGQSSTSPGASHTLDPTAS